MEHIEWQTVHARVDDLIPHKSNPRKINTKQMSDLKKSLETYNLAEIPVVNLDGVILSGHQRIKALQLLGRGRDIIDIRKPNRQLTEDEAKRYLVGANALFFLML